MNKQSKNNALKYICFTAFLMSTQSLYAAEGGLGRSITGMQVVPLNGILPLEEGGVLSLSSIYYEGDIERSKQIPIVGNLVSGIDYQLSYNLLNGVFVWKTSPKWSLATSVGVPVQYTNIEVSLNQFEKQQSSTKIGDVMFSPLLVNYHLNPIMHAMFGVNIYAPTGSYEQGNLSNPGLNVWTFVPNVATTVILPKMNVELTTTAAYEIYSRNKDTNYQNGDIFRMDFLGLKRFGETGSGNGLGVGVNAGWIEQVNDDEGPLAKRLDGFKGRSLGAGPIVTYEKKYKDFSLSGSLRGVYEFDVKNRPEGEAYQLSVSLQY